MIRRVFTCTWILCAALIAARVGLSAQATSAPASQASNPDSRLPNPGSKGHDRPVLRHLPQRASQVRRSGARERGRRAPREQRRDVGKGRPQAPSGRHATARRTSARRRDDAVADRVARDKPRPGCRCAPESRPPAAASAQSRGVQERDQGSPGARCRRGDTAAAGRLGVRLRQHL